MHAKSYAYNWRLAHILLGDFPDIGEIDCPIIKETNSMNMGKTLPNKSWWYEHNKTMPNTTVCIFVGYIVASKQWEMNWFETPCVIFSSILSGPWLFRT